MPNDSQLPTEAQPRSPSEMRRDPIIVQDVIPVLDTGRFEQMQRIASVMAQASLIPEQLIATYKDDEGNEQYDAKGTVANCFLVVNQAVRWQMDPFALAQHVFVLNGKLGYEGKVIAAVVNNHRKLEGSLAYIYDGEGQERTIIVSGVLHGEKTARELQGSVGQWKTTNKKWIEIPDQMLAYRGAREWARRYMPEAVLGVLSDDELYEIQDRGVLKEQADGTYAPPPRPKPTDYQAQTALPAQEEPQPQQEAEEAEPEQFDLVDEVGEVVSSYPPDVWKEKYLALLNGVTDRQQLYTVLDNNSDTVAAFSSNGWLDQAYNESVNEAFHKAGGGRSTPGQKPTAAPAAEGEQQGMDLK